MSVAQRQNVPRTIAFKKKKLSEKSLLKQGVFGRPLDELLLVQGEQVPLVVQQCVKWLEENALDEEGLFRVPGESMHIEKLKALYDKDPLFRVDWDAEKPSAATVAGLLKVYFRELPQPVTTFELYNTILKIAKMEEYNKKLLNERILIHKLPKPQKDALLYLIKFLHEVSLHIDKNKMSPMNLSTCWSPNLVKSLTETGTEMMFHAEFINSTIMDLIENYHYMKDPVDPPQKLEGIDDDVDKIVAELVKEQEEVAAFLYAAVRSPRRKHGSTFTRDSSKNIVSGWLHKQGGSVKTWKSRFCILTGAVLQYYKDPKDTAIPVGEIPLPSYVPKKATAEECKKPFPFKLEHKGPCRTWYFSANTEDDRDRWVSALEEALRKFSAAVEIGQIKSAEVENMMVKEDYQVKDDDFDSDDEEEEEEEHFLVSSDELTIHPYDEQYLTNLEDFSLQDLRRKLMLREASEGYVSLFASISVT